MGLDKLLFLSVLLFSFLSQGDIVFFPQEELPNESIVPQLDSPQAVTARKISFTKRWEPLIAYGWLLDEPFYKSDYVAAGLTYSWSELYGVTARYMSWAEGLSNYANQFATTAASLRFERGYGPSSGYSLSFNQRLFYGKISFSKNLITPITLTTIYEGGIINYGGRGFPFGGAGIINAWYFTKNWSFDIGLKFFIRQALDPLSADLRSIAPTPKVSDFNITNRFSTNLDLGFQYIF